MQVVMFVGASPRTDALKKDPGVAGKSFQEPRKHAICNSFYFFGCPGQTILGRNGRQSFKTKATIVRPEDWPAVMAARSTVADSSAGGAEMAASAISCSVAC